MPEQTQQQTETILTPQERANLNAFKWRYSLEAAGFSPAEARRLVWARWAVRSKRLGVG